jgi:CheY-like chemotaxis protein
VHPAASILIVDDHDGFRRFARGMLEAAGFTVAEAATGAEAAEAARSVRPGLVLLDIQLPDSDGFEVARQLAAGRPGGPVIVLTSTREASDYGARITSSPAAGFLPKDQLSGVPGRGRSRLAALAVEPARPAVQPGRLPRFAARARLSG